MSGEARAVHAVFVYADGKVGLMAIPSQHGAPPYSWRRAKQRPFNAFASAADDVSQIAFEVEEFRYCGKMFDGRPLYCADGFDVKEIRFSETASMANDRERVLEHVQNEASRFMGRECPGGIALDHWSGEAPVDRWTREDLRRKGLVQLCARLLVASRNLSV